MEAAKLLPLHLEQEHETRERALDDMGQHVLTVHGEAALESFNLGHHTFFLYALSQVIAKKYPNEPERFFGAYIKSAEEVNIELRRLEIPERLVLDARALDEVGKQILSVRRAIDARLASDRE